MSVHRSLGAALVAAALGCSSTPVEGTLLTAAALEGVEAKSIPLPASLGTVRALSEANGDMLVAGDRRFALLEREAWSVHATGDAKLIAAARAPSSVAYARFLAVGSAGELFAIFDDARTLDLASRYGFTSGELRMAADLGDRGAAFGLTDGYAIARDGEVTRVALAGVSEVFSCHASIFVRTASSLYRLDASARPAFVTVFPAALAGAACDAQDRVVAMTATTLWREGGSALAPIVEGSDLANLVGTSEGIAFTQSGALCTLVESALRCSTRDGAFTKLFRSQSELPYALTAAGDLVALVRPDRDAGLEADGASPPTQDASSADAGTTSDGGPTGDAGPSADETAWTTRVRPIAERACFGCHGTVGAASVSLTTYAAWVTNRNAIRQRVVTQQNMPPNASNLASADRSVIAAWLGTN